MNRHQACAKAWLMRYDSEAARFWRDLPDDSDFVGAVRDNINSYGPDETGMAECLVLEPSVAPLP